MREYAIRNMRHPGPIRTNQSLQAVIGVIELSEQELNDVVELGVGEDLVIEGWFYIRRDK